ncbi:alpha/beta fold hydrolase [Anthocerotibacter panamensis]|uniref:alpha/beta fold hydrolase n=1 Tax=Anthocerotibacter panamensis TaxID=2857077 RepID=UPI001C402EC8|nr:alpha/beta hydrolase [Anthocerotibacter panamensis]
MGLNLQQMGSGPPVLLIHGAASCSRVWEPQMCHLAAQGFTAIAVDLPGHGLSVGSGTIAAAVAGVAELLPAVQPVAVVGYSFGGVVAIEVARHYPVPGLLLVCPAVAIPPSTSYFYDWLMGWPLDWIARYRSWLKPWILSPMGRLSLDENPHTIRELWPLLRAWSGTLTHLNMPIWVAGGRLDHIAPPRVLDHFTRRLPQGHLTLFGGRHRPMESEPERFNAWLMQGVRMSL